MDTSPRSGIVARIIWLLVASAIVILTIRLMWDITSSSPQGQVATTLYGWSTTLLMPVDWLYQQIALPTTLPGGFSIYIPIAIGLYVVCGWLVTALLGLLGRGK